MGESADEAEGICVPDTCEQPVALVKKTKQRIQVAKNNHKNVGPKINKFYSDEDCDDSSNPCKRNSDCDMG
jgi:hypothetical protein